MTKKIPGLPTSLLSLRTILLLLLWTLSAWAESPTVLTALPNGDLDEESWSREIRFVFNVPMIPLTSVGQAPQVEGVVMNPPVGGTWRWAGTDTLLFLVSGRLPRATTFTVTLPGSLASVSGQSLGNPYTLTFNTPRPRLVDQDPSSQSRDVPLSQNVTLFFDQEVQVKGSVKYLDLWSEGTLNTGNRWREETVAEGLYGGKNEELAEALSKWQDRVKAAKKKTVPFRISYGHSNERDIQAWKTAKVTGTPKPVPAGIDKRILVLEPLEALPRSANISFKLSAGLKGLEGDLGTSDGEFQFTTFHDFFIQDAPVKDINPLNPGSLTFTTPVAMEGLRPYLFLNEYDGNGNKVRTLPLPKDLGRGTGKYFWLSAWNLKAATPYELVVVKGATNIYGDALPATFTHRFTTANLPQYLEMPTGTMLVESYFPRKLPMGVCNVKSADIGVRLLSPDEIGEYLNRRGDKQVDGAKRVSFGAQLNRAFQTSLDLPGGEGDVVAAFSVKPKDTFPTPFKDAEDSLYTGLVQFTSLAIGAKAGWHEMLVYVADISNTQPLEGFTVNLYRKDGSLVWRGKTDAMGFCRAPGKKLAGNGDWWVWVEKGPRRGFVHADFTQDLDTWNFNIHRDWNENPDRALGYLLTDRGVYRQGETVYLKGILRRITNEVFGLPVDRTAKVTVRDRAGSEIYTNQVTLSEFGSFDVSFDLPKDLPLGPVSAVVSWEGTSASTEFLATQFRAPLFRNTVAATGATRFAGDREHFDVKGEWLFGAPIQQAEIRYNLGAADAQFSPPLRGETGDWIFSDSEESPHGGRTRRVENRVSGTGAMNGGRFAIDLNLGSGAAEIPRVWTFEAEIVTPDKQSVAGRSSVLVHPASVYAGLKRARYFTDTEKGLDFQAGAAAIDGAWAPGRPMELTLLRREWKTAMRRGLGEGVHHENSVEDTVVWKQTVTSLASASSLKAPLKDAGYHILRSEVKDAQGRSAKASFGFYAFGGTAGAWWFEDGDQIDLTPEKDTYKPGDTARIMVKSPWPESRALITVERGRVLESRWQDLKGHMPLVEIPIRGNHSPNVLVGVLLMKGRQGFEVDENHFDKGIPVVKIGYTGLAVIPDGARLLTEVKPAATRYEPGQVVDVSVSLKDALGSPVAGEVTLFAVDEAVTSLTGFRPPDPIAHFYQPRGLNILTVDNRPYVLKQRYFGSKGAEPGGGGGDDSPADANLRSDFKVTPFFTGSLITGAQGTARTNFKLPDNLTTFKLFAVGADASRFGSGEGAVTVSKPFMLQPSFPRFAIRGDGFKAAILVHNLGAEPGTVTLRTTGDLRMQAPGDEITFRLGAKSSTNLRLDYLALTEGEANLTVRGSLVMNGGTKQDGFVLKLPVKVPVATETTAATGVLTATTPSRTEKVLLPTGVYRDVGGLRVETTTSLLQDLKTSLDYLRSYPHGCVEQTSSRLLAAGYQYALAQEFPVAGEPVDLALLSGIVSHLYKFQKPGGGLGYWPDSERANPWGTAWALIALKQVTRQDLPVRESFLKGALDYLAKQVKAKDDDAHWGYEWTSTSRIFMLLALAQHGRFEPAIAEVLAEKSGNLTVLARAQLLEVLARQKSATGRGDSSLQKVKAALMNAASIDATLITFQEKPYAGWEYLFNSDTRTTAAALSALSAVDPNSPLLPKIIRGLQLSRKAGRWNNTQENAFAARAFFDYQSAMESEKPAMDASVTLSGNALQKTRWDGRSFKVEAVTVPMADLFARIAPGSPVDLSFTKDGPGTLYYTARLSAAPEPGTRPAVNQGFRLNRRYLHTEGPLAGKADTVFKAGEVVKVVLEVESPSPRLFAALEDPIPAGFEILDDRLQTTAKGLMADATQASSEPWEWYPMGWSHKEAHDHRMLVYADRLGAGAKPFVYLVRATTPGRFTAAAGKIECMYSPEIFGSIPAETITVKETP